jgi:hypothetical protein
MDGPTLQDLISKGWGVSARRTGSPYAVYRPNGTANPCTSSNRVIKLKASFTPLSSIATGAVGYAGVLWRGVFDSKYTCPGDYLVGPSSSFFIASQWPMQPIVCIQVGNTVSIARPSAATNASYSGFTSNSAQNVIAGWPAQLVVSGNRVPGALPQSHFDNWSGFLPLLPASPQVADILCDDSGRRFVIGGTQLSSLGWRLAMRQVDG